MQNEGDNERLVAAAATFADELSTRVWRVIGNRVSPFVGAAVASSGLVVVRQEPREGIELRVEGAPTLRLFARYRCRWDHEERFLAVDKSNFRAHAVIAPSEPLFRVEYVRNPAGSAPVAHLQIHAERQEMTDALIGCGTASARARKRAKRTKEGKSEPRLAEIHFPLGGHRFRPCLEDFLQMLIDEFGVDHEPTARPALLEGRAQWRRMQLAAAVRDSPETAAAALERFGYTVVRPAVGPASERLDRLHQL